MSDEEAPPRVHPLRYASVFIYAILIYMDTFLRTMSISILLRKDLTTFSSLFGPMVIVYGVAATFAGLFWGWMADKYGRKPPLIISGICTFPALLLFAFAAEPWHFLVAYAFNGISGSAGIMITRVLVADLSPRKALGERIAALSTIMSAGSFIVMWFGGFYFYNLDYHIPFLIVAAISEAAALPLAYFAIPETLVKRKSSTELTGAEERKPSRTNRFVNGAKEWFAILGRRGFLLYLLSILVGAIVGRAISTLVYPLFAINFGLTPTQISIVYTVGMISFLGMIPGGILSDRIGRKWPVLFAGFFGALTNFFYTLMPGMSDPFLVYFLIHLVSAVAGVVSGPAFLAYFYEWLRPKERGRASAMIELFEDLAVTFGFPLVAWIYSDIDPVSAFYFAAIVGILVTIFLWAAWKEAPLPEGKWKLRKSTILLIAAEIILIVIVIIVWLF